jgi:23S rRNA G2069 N7-methylase RlmK/C1962 C5-methylase RlmI
MKRRETALNDDHEQRLQDLGEMLVNRIQKNRRRLRSWIKREEITCFRLYDRDIPEIPLTIDWYEGRLCVARYEKGESSPPDEDWVSSVLETVGEALGVAPDHVYVRSRRRGPGGSRYSRRATERDFFLVREAGKKFRINLSDYLDTGLFLDHRATRKMVGLEAAGKRFLNLFAYTGAFSVYAAAAGAVGTTTVDMSNTYLDWARRNMAINGFDGPEHQFIRDDIFNALDERRVEGEYDLVVFDPPTVSKSKRMKRDLDIQRDYAWMLNRILEICAPGAVIYFSTNFKKFRFDETKVQCDRIVEISKKTIPPDFRDGRVHRCWRFDAPGSRR